MNTVIDCETTRFPNALPHNGHLVSIHLFTGSESRSWLYDHPESIQSQLEIIKEVQEYINESKRVIGHNFKFDYKWLTHIGLDLSKVLLYDTLVAEYVIRHQPDLSQLSLNDLCTHYNVQTKLDKVKLYWDSGYETDEIPANVLCPYGEQDCRSTMAVFEKQIPIIRQRGIESLISVEMEVFRYFGEAELAGMLVDTDALEMYKKDCEEEVAEADKRLAEIVGPDISFSSPVQLSAAIYGGEYKVEGIEATKKVLKDGTVKHGTRKCQVKKYHKGLGIKPLPNTETKSGGYKTDHPTLIQLKSNTAEGKEFLELYAKRAKANTLNKTFFNGFLERQVGGYLYPSLEQCVTKTSRMSCRNPKHDGVVKLCEFRETLRVCA